MKILQASSLSLEASDQLFRIKGFTENVKNDATNNVEPLFLKQCIRLIDVDEHVNNSYAVVLYNRNPPRHVVHPDLKSVVVDDTQSYTGNHESNPSVEQGVTAEPESQNTPVVEEEICEKS
ncbi:hypothetical protein L2E82_33173 [Cichorium intybus]|uniref:Uncharacterized protein n=1 Tax=Cichorium intybus TaxID=13427 RepID=A0ACB9BJF5_CICIN|nr:hypothetical protein L2E82_33173 [Cichorium intybus]